MSISAIIPVHNGEKYLAEAIDSVLAQRTRQRIELIVVDDGSTDSSAAIIRGYGNRVRYLYQENAGVGAARNAGIMMARHDLLAFLDADDIWVANKTEIQLDALLADSDIEAVYGLSEQFLSHELDPVRFGHLKILDKPVVTRLSHAMLIRRVAMERIGPFADLLIGCDIEWGMRSRDLALRDHVVDSIVVRRRIHGDNHTSRLRDDRIAYARIIKQSLDRRRTGNQ